MPKTNWANAIDTPPFEAYEITCGITFTFGGLKIDTNSRVVDTEGVQMPVEAFRLVMPPCSDGSKR